MSCAYYNDNEPSASAWLRELMSAGLIMEGTIDERSISKVQPDDLRGFTRVHWFAGIAGWDLALQYAGWPADRPVWTASLPCPSFSCAGKGDGFADPRGRLWRPFARLVRECRPGTLFGEQVEAAIGHGWLDRVFSDLEDEGYACAAAVLPACAVGAPHRRQRLFWVAHAAGGQREQLGWPQREAVQRSADDGPTDRMANSKGARVAPLAGRIGTRIGTVATEQPQQCLPTDRMAHAGSRGLDVKRGDTRSEDAARTSSRLQSEHGGNAGPVADMRLARLEGQPGDERDGDQPGRLETDPAGSVAEGGPTGGVGDAASGGCRVGGHAALAWSRGHIERAVGAGPGAVANTEHDGQYQPAGATSIAHKDRSHGGLHLGGHSYWSKGITILCRDGKTRRFERQPATLDDGVPALLDALRRAGASEAEIVAALETFPLVQNQAGRVNLLRGYGNSIVVPLAAEFIRACLESVP